MTKQTSDEHSFDIVVIGGGPGGYPAAIHAAKQGKRVALVEMAELGGVCLNWGCIPTKSLLKSAEVLNTVAKAGNFGVSVDGFSPDLGSMVKRSRGVVDSMKTGVTHLLKNAGVTVFRGKGTLLESGRVVVQHETDSTLELCAEHTIVATGARPMELPSLPIDGTYVLSSTEAMIQERIPRSLAVVGGGAIGVEFACFYNSLGTNVTLVERMDCLVPAEDAAVSAELKRSFEASGITVMTDTEVTGSAVKDEVVSLNLRCANEVSELRVERALSAIGVTPNTEDIGLETIGVETQHGKITVDEFYQTTVSGIYAIGDVIAGPALAHVATAEALVCVNAICDLSAEPIDYLSIPSCVYTQPEIASFGLTEVNAAATGKPIKSGVFPLSASGKARAMGVANGFVKLVIDEKYGEILGAHMIGPNVTELIAELVVAHNAEATWLEIAHSVHPHPTLSEAVMESAAKAFDSAIHI